MSIVGEETKGDDKYDYECMEGGSTEEVMVQMMQMEEEGRVSSQENMPPTLMSSVNADDGNGDASNGDDGNGDASNGANDGNSRVSKDSCVGLIVSYHCRQRVLRRSFRNSLNKTVCG